MVPSEIHFGTEGWRGVLGVDFTTANLSRVIAAVVHWLRHPRTPHLPQEGEVLLGYDTRFLAGRFASLAARLLREAGIKVRLSRGFVSTPGLCAGIVARRASLGIMITASHNPPEYLGVKIKGSYGGSATVEMIAELERSLAEIPPQPSLPFPPEDQEEQLALEELHLKRIRQFLPPSSGRLVVVHDAMFGAAQGLFRRLLREKGKVVELRSQLNPGFEGAGPEPVPERLKGLFAEVRRLGAAFGFATDGDGDRIAACDGSGRFLYPHEILALNLLYLVDHLGYRGRVVCNLATSQLIRRIAESRGLGVTFVPVGFKHIVPEMLKGDVLIAGEESGGIAVAPYLLERDGIMNAHLLRELLLIERKPLRELVKKLQKQYGPLHFRREDLHLDQEAAEKVRMRLRGDPPLDLQGERVIQVEQRDGMKLWFQDHGWILVRMSGTEPLLRIYGEAPKARDLLKRMAGAKGYFLP